MPRPEIKNASDGWARASYNGWKTNDICWLGEAVLSGTLDSVVGRVGKVLWAGARRSGQISNSIDLRAKPLLRVMNA
jgi:hypothetical protein